MFIMFYSFFSIIFVKFHLSFFIVYSALVINQSLSGVLVISLLRTQGSSYFFVYIALIYRQKNFKTNFSIFLISDINTLILVFVTIILGLNLHFSFQLSKCIHYPSFVFIENNCSSVSHSCLNDWHSNVI